MTTSTFSIAGPPTATCLWTVHLQSWYRRLCYSTGALSLTEIQVKTYTKGGSFGELALMYNSPRAATIIAQTDVVCWAVDRITFRKMLMETTSTSRRKYEQFLGAVKILASLDQSERARVADALVEQNFKDGDYVIRQGETGEEFHIIVQGNAKVGRMDRFVYDVRCA